MTAKTKDWPGLKIKRALEDAGYSQADVARDTRKSRAAINHVVWRGFTSDFIRRNIAEKIGVDVSVIWPSYYLKDQKRAT